MRKKNRLSKIRISITMQNSLFRNSCAKIRKHLNENIHPKKIERCTFARYVEAGLGFVLEKVNSMTTDKTHHYPGLKGLF